MQRVTVFLVTVLAAATLGAQRSPATTVPRLWTQAALAGWALPIAGVNATPNFYTEAEYYAAPVDEVRTYPVYLKGREPAGYRDWLRQQGPQPLIEPSKLQTETDWIAAGRDVFDGLHLARFRSASPRAFQWADDPDLVVHERVTVAADGTIPGARWVIDHDGALKIVMTECSQCHSRLLADGSVARGAQTNLNMGSLLGISFMAGGMRPGQLARMISPNDEAYESYGAPWVKDDIHASLKTMPSAELARLRPGGVSGTFTRFNASPWATTKIPDLAGIADRRYLDATATHRNRGPEDIARYAILVSAADDGSVGPYTFVSAPRRPIPSRYSDEAMLALGKYLYSLQPPPNPNRPSAETARGQRVFNRSGCANCHTPPLYTNNKLARVDGFEPFDHANAPPPADVMSVALGLDATLALRTRKGTGYYKVPSLKGVWYRGPLEHSGSIPTLEEWLDPGRLRADYTPKGWNPPGVKTRAIPGHPFGLNLNADDKRALIAFLRTL
jgi:mono/diheme cytochrome c family protein